MQKVIGNLLVALIGGVLLLFAASARGQANVNWDSDNGLSPSTVGIAPGGTVTWNNVDIYGFDVQITCSGSFSFDLPQFSSQPVVFPPYPGVYNYTANSAGSPTGYGSVVVVPPPTVTITSPTNNAVFPASAIFTVQATAAVYTNDYINDVQFFLDNGTGPNSIADVFTPPYTTGVTNLAAGGYTLTAIVTDIYGLTGTNAITLTITGGAPVSLASPRFAAGSFLFDMTGLTIGKTNIVFASTDLVSWTPVTTNVATDTLFTATNTAAVAQQYYRILQLP